MFPWMGQLSSSTINAYPPRATAYPPRATAYPPHIHRLSTAYPPPIHRLSYIIQTGQPGQTDPKGCSFPMVT